MATHGTLGWGRVHSTGDYISTVLVAREILSDTISRLGIEIVLKNDTKKINFTQKNAVLAFYVTFL